MRHEQNLTYNKDELNPPSFLDKDYFEDIFRTTENDKNLKVTDLKIIPGSKPGDHFASIMFKVKLAYISQGKQFDDVSLVLKTMPVEDGIKLDMLRNTTLFDTEIKMYTTILPEMNRLLESIGEEENLAPKMIYQSAEPPVLIFEDITKQNYTMFHKPLDFDETVKIILKLAKFHALSFHMDPEKYGMKIKNCFLSQSMMDVIAIFVEYVESLGTVIREWPGYENIADKLKKLKPRFLEKLFNLYEAQLDDSNNYCLLSHGDFHLKNMMFKLKDGDKIESVYFIDFQTCFWGSQSYDLIYSLYTVGSHKVRDRRDELLSIYHSRFVEILEKLGCKKKPQSLTELHMDVLKHGFFEVFIAICFMPFFVVDFSKIDMEDLFDVKSERMDNFRKQMYNQTDIAAVMKTILPEFLCKGLLD